MRKPKSSIETLIQASGFQPAQSTGSHLRERNARKPIHAPSSIKIIPKRAGK